MQRLIIALTAAAAFTGTSLPARADDAPSSKQPPEMLTGDWGGLRTALKERNGLEFTITDINELFGVLSGGLKRAPSYEGRTEFTVEADLGKLGWKDATAHVTVYQLRNSGRNVGQNVGSLSDPSNIDALGTTRLFTAWLQQTWLGERVSLRVGQLAADDEFLTSTTAAGLINGTFGWPDLHNSNMVSGGPAFPLATPGARLAVKPTDDITLQAAVFSGNPAGADCSGLPQACNRYGTTFSFTGGVLAIGEVQYAVNQGRAAAGLPGVYKLGAWHATGDYNDLHDGLSASGIVVSLGLDSTATPIARHGDHGFYGVADQMVWRAGGRSINVFVRGGLVPPDRNQVAGYVDGGVAFKGFVPGWKEDVLTLGAAYAKLSNDLAAVDADAGNVVRDHELVLEASYTRQMAPWWTLQPDIQYIAHPNGGQNPNNPAVRLGNAVVLGVRSTVKF